MYLQLKQFLLKHDLAAILLLAFCLRLLGIQHTNDVVFPEFFRDYYSVSSIIRGTSFPLHGPPSILGGFHFGPFYYYYLVPFLWLFRLHPVGLIIGSIAASVGSIYFLYKLVYLWFRDYSIARVAAVLCTLSIYSVRMSNYVSNPNLLPFFVLWFFYHLTLLADGNDTWPNTVLLGLSFGCAVQLHVTAMIVLPLVLASVLLFTKAKVTTRSVVVFFSSATAVLGPYLYYELVTRLDEVRRLVHLGATQLGAHTGVLGNLSALYRFAEGTLVPAINPEYSYTYLEPNYLYYPLAVGVLVLAGSLVYKLLRHQFDLNASSNIHVGRPGVVILISWIASTVAILLVYRRFVRYYYLIILWPVPMIALALFIFWFKAHFRMYYLVIGLWLLVCLLELYSYETLRSGSWSEFYSEYSQIRATTNITEIGAPGVVVH
jgi:4-amino-4-deoxy-L-arabinose transferase-like glycosyltransferase